MTIKPDETYGDYCKRCRAEKRLTSVVLAVSIAVLFIVKLLTL